MEISSRVTLIVAIKPVETNGVDDEVIIRMAIKSPAATEHISDVSELEAKMFAPVFGVPIVGGSEIVVVMLVALKFGNIGPPLGLSKPELLYTLAHIFVVLRLGPDYKFEQLNTNFAVCHFLEP